MRTERVPELASAKGQQHSPALLLRTRGTSSARALAGVFDRRTFGTLEGALPIARERANLSVQVSANHVAQPRSRLALYSQLRGFFRSRRLAAAEGYWHCMFTKVDTSFRSRSE